MIRRRALLAAPLLAAPAVRPAWAEAEALRIGAQFGIGYLPLYVAKADGLIDAALRDAGLPPVAVEVTNVTGAPDINDGLLSGGFDVGCGGTTALMVAVERTRTAGARAMRGLAALSAVPYVLLSANPAITSLAGVGPDQRIGVPAARVSVPAVLLEMAAERAFGQLGRLDANIVSLSQPDGATALRAHSGVVDLYALAPPFTEQIEGAPGVARIWSSTELFNEPVTALAAWTTARFHADNPRICAALVAALRAAMHRIATDPAAAARIYLAAEGNRLPVEMIVRSITRPDVHFGTQPARLLEVGAFMARAGRLRAAPAAWTDLFHPDIHAAGGS